MSVFGNYKYAKNYKKLLFACYAFTVMVFAIKLIYTAQLPVIIDAFKTTKTQASLGLTIYYFVYAVAQIVVGLFILKINMKNYLLITSALSAITFSMIGFTNNLTIVWVIFGLNGILQAGAWGGVIFIITKYFPNDTLSGANKILATAATVGNSLAYVISALFVEVSTWQATFLFCGALFLISVIYLFVQIIKVDTISKRKDENPPQNNFNNKKEKQIFVVPSGIDFNVKLFITFIIIISIFANCLVYGLGNWIPNLLKEVYFFPSSLSILLTMFMPLIAMSGTLSMYNIFDRSGKIFQKTAVTSLILLAIIIAMIFGFDFNFVFAIFMCALLKFLPNCITAASSSYTLMKIKNYMNSGTSMLIVNAGAAFSAGLMPFITGYVMDQFGWQAYYIFMAMICLLLIITVFITLAVMKKKNNILKWF